MRICRYLIFLKVPIGTKERNVFIMLSNTVGTSDLRQCPNMQFQSVIENYNVKHILYRYYHHIIVFKLQV